MTGGGGEGLDLGERFALGRRIGHGAMGVVHEGHDRVLDRPVAIKLYVRDDQITLSRVRRVYERLAGLRHPNVVELVELIDRPGATALVMELIHGQDFMSYCRAGRATPATDSTPAAPGCDLDRLRGALPQLAAGLHTLHARDVIHRDVKPDNVRVTAEGRVVILDFSLSEERWSEPARAGGTVAYMAPEQAFADAEPTAASDWYAVGVMLYEALAGRLPFDGPPMRVLQDKSSREPIAVEQLIAGVPADLAALCRTLLAAAAERRPDGAEVLRRLGVASSQGAGAAAAPARIDVGLLGRGNELDELWGRFEAVVRQRSAIVLVDGAEGAGKSALLGELARQLRHQRRDALVLDTHCTPDPLAAGGVLDELGEQLLVGLAGMDDHERRALVPAEAGALRLLLPALARSPALAEAPEPDFDDPAALRTAALGGLRDLLSRLARRRPVVWLIDDAHLADADTLTALDEVMRPPDPPPILLVMARLPDAAGAGRLERIGEGAVLLPLPPLDEAELQHLLAELPGDPAHHAAAARAAGGNPRLAGALAAEWRAGRVPPDPATLATVLKGRVRRLSAPARRLLAGAALSGSPLPDVAAALGIDGAPAAMAELTTAGLVRRHPATGATGMDPAVRALATADLAPDALRDLGAALATRLPGVDAGWRCRLWSIAGDGPRITEQATRAAEQARAVLRFERAAAACALALDANPIGGSSDSGVRIAALRLTAAEMLAAAGHGAAAAQHYALLAAAAPPAVRLELGSRAAHLLVIGGRAAEGRTSFRKLLAGIGIEMADTPRRALLRLLGRRARLRLRGSRWRPRAAGDIPAAQRAAVETTSAAGYHIGLVDPIVAAELQARALAMAFEVGDPDCLARAAAVESVFLCSQGAGARADRLLELAAATARGPLARAWVRLGEAAREFFIRCAWRRTVEACDEVNEMLRRQPTQAALELDVARTYASFGLLHLGEVDELARRIPAQIQEAGRRSDAYAGFVYRVRLNALWLLRGDPRGATDALREGEAMWPLADTPFGVQQFYAMLAACEQDLWRGDAAAAAARLERDLPDLQRSHLLRVRMVRCEAESLAGRIEVRRLAAGQGRPAHLRQLIASLRRSALPVGSLHAALLAASRESGETAAATLRDAAARADALEMRLHAAAARHRLGQLLRGTEGEALVDQARHALRMGGVVDVDGLVNSLLPAI